MNKCTWVYFKKSTIHVHHVNTDCPDIEWNKLIAVHRYGLIIGTGMEHKKYTLMCEQCTEGKKARERLQKTEMVGT